MIKLKDRFVNKAMKILTRYKDKQEVQTYINEIQTSYSKLVNKADLTKDQAQEVQSFYSMLLGHPIPLDWHNYFTARTGVYSKLYFPTSEYKTSIVGRLNVYPLKRAYTDKNMTNIILPNTKQPKVFLKNMNGYFYFEGVPVSREEAIEKSGDLGEVIMKPSLTARGQGVVKLNLQKKINVEDRKSLSQIFDEYKKDYLIEELVRQHPDMAALNESSVNTIRFLSYRSGMEVYIVYSVIRIGRMNQTIDNESAGGISAKIDEDGKIAQFAYGAPGVDKVEYTDSGVKLKGYQVPSYRKAVEFVKEQHLYLPFFDLVAWDVAIDVNGDPVMIEFNMTPDLSQSANGPAFGQYTEMILKDAMSRYNTYSIISKEYMWKRNC